MNLCRHCNRTFATPSSLKRHISARHSSETDDHTEAQTRHQCPHCHAYFVRGETLRRHVRSKHEGDLNTCSFCLKQFRADYMQQHSGTCARKYWQKIERHASLIDDTDMAQSKSRSCSSRLSPPNDSEEDSLHMRNEELLGAQDQKRTLRIIYENAFDARLAADSLTQTMWWSVETGNVESYKAALVTTLRLKITNSNLTWPHKQLDCFAPLYRLALHIDHLVRWEKRGIGFGTIENDTVLLAACRAGVAELLEPMFWRGACFNALPPSNVTPLRAAISSGDLDTVRFALALGSDPHLHCPLSDAFFAEEHDILTLLLDHGADINDDYGDLTILSVAVENCDLEQVRLALSLGADPNVQHPMDELIAHCLHKDFHHCVHADMACLLIEHGADVSRQNWRGNTIFHLAVIKSHAQLLRMALDRISSPKIFDLENDNKQTPLHCASGVLHPVSSQRAVISASMLLEAGADVNVQNSDGQSALMFTARGGSDDLVRLLLDAGATVRTPFQYGPTALSHAAEQGHSTIVGLLLEKAPPTLGDSSYLTLPLRAAINGHHVDVVKQLMSYGADSSAGLVLSLAPKSLESEVLQILVDAGARFG